jgi:GGDEF domain-containing protein
MSISRLLHQVLAVSPATTNNEVYELFEADAGLMIIPVVDEGVPLGLITRFVMIQHFARPYERELFGRKSCCQFMDGAPIIADKDTTLQELSLRMASADAHHLFNGFIITEGGRYLGMGTGHDLMREITQLQIQAARHANPLTQLPGNVPINEQIARLLREETRFCLCYGDIDHFKPFNDVYGYRRGDDAIVLLGQILTRHGDPERDFVGHIGGDDFVILFRSEDWEPRCHAILADFGERMTSFYSDEDREQGGFYAEDRQGRKVFHPLMSLSLGAIQVEPRQYDSHHRIAARAAEAKKQAKKAHGDSLFVERRLGPAR